MRIANAMFGCGLGGIEQAFIDYTKALMVYGHKVTAIYHPDAQIAGVMEPIPVYKETLHNRGFWDIFAARRLRHLLEHYEIDAVIAHGNRAVSLCRKAAKGKIPVIGVCHNYRLKRLIGCDALLTITEDLRQTAIKAGQPEASVHVIPNMINLPAGLTGEPKPWHQPPVIGAMGRFVHKKGFHIFLEALKQLKDKGVIFSAVLGGDGEEKEKLQQCIQEYGLSNIVQLTGWVEDKAVFFQGIDIFCVPSLHEPFGIVLLEGFLHQVPIVSTASEGPREIITSGEDGVLAPVNDALALAEALQKVITDKQTADKLVIQAVDTLKKRYALPVVAEKIHRVLEGIGNK